MKPCLKQTVVALIYKHGQLLGAGSNMIYNDGIVLCPREGMKTGEGYEKCKDICKQGFHAEIEACHNAYENFRDISGSTLYLIGHTYACEDCISKMKVYGIKKLVVCDTGVIINL